MDQVPKPADPCPECGRPLILVPEITDDSERPRVVIGPGLTRSAQWDCRRQTPTTLNLTL
jgi:hypothetical protein